MSYSKKPTIFQNSKEKAYINSKYKISDILTGPNRGGGNSLIFIFPAVCKRI